MIAVAKPDRDRNLGFNTLKAALFHSGRPVLMCPPADTPPVRSGAQVALAWNGSAEAARALVAVHRRAADRGRSHHPVATGRMPAPAPSADDLVTYLGLHGIARRGSRRSLAEPECRARTAGRRPPRLGADMLVMGAYGDSHERETVFGGNTQTVVDTARIPVLFNH